MSKHLASYEGGTSCFLLLSLDFLTASFSSRLGRGALGHHFLYRADLLTGGTLALASRAPLGPLGFGVNSFEGQEPLRLGHR